MTTTNQLFLRVSTLVGAAEARREARERERARVMARVEDRIERFEQTAVRLLANTVRPRLEVLLRMFPHAGPIEVLHGGHGLAVPFAHTEDFPAHARVDVSLSHDADGATAWCTFAPSIIPILMDYERDACIDVNLDAPDLARLEEFLDARVERFVISYLSLREPESMYQRDLRVLDPVCGMTIRRVDAHGHLDHGGQRIFFCTDACRRRYEANPERYDRQPPPARIDAAKWPEGSGRGPAPQEVGS